MNIPEGCKMAASHPGHPVLSSVELLKLSSDIGQAIERCGASVELTNAVTLATDMYFHLRRYIEQVAPAAHLTIPGALEWDGNNGTHGVVGTHSADGEHGESCVKSSGPEGRRERFQKWVLATKHPVLGFLDGHWLKRGDDREGYANEYVQGLWVAYKAFASPPAPVSAYTAVDMTTAAAGGFRDGQESAANMKRALAGMLFAFDDGVGLDWSAELLDFARALVSAEEFKPDCTQAAFDDIPDFTPGSGNKAKRRIAEIEKAKQKTCIECDQPYCHGVCVERGDQDYDRDQAAKGGDDE